MSSIPLSIKSGDMLTVLVSFVPLRPVAVRWEPSGWKVDDYTLQDGTTLLFLDANNRGKHKFLVLTGEHAGKIVYEMSYFITKRNFKIKKFL